MTPAFEPPRPTLAGVTEAVREAAEFLDRAAAARGASYVNTEGGDVGMHGSVRSVVRHTVHYLAAAELAQRSGLAGPVLDVGSGVGGLAAWMAHRLHAPLHLADHDTAVLAVAQRAFPEVVVHTDLEQLHGWAPLVTAMEVIEHIPPDGHDAFVGLLYRQVAPGGLLVMSTPDETGYPGGWSGYAPHVGCVDAAGLAGLLQRAAGGSATVWRLEGEVFALGGLRRYVEAGLNRVWGALTRHAPGAAARLGSGAGRVAPSYRRLTAAPFPADARAVPPEQGTGTGLLGVVSRPAQ